ncbi:hypothetical protein EIN_023660 [Entamoeba invadens IP1]|uniref:Uncharacterized protein n=1 Tax=Entamoeba invadens TaxID=33085 RepID=S0B5V5_ENTIV|nr:hypothetical protein EIN_023660 [Entamoeba invadens IP1]ELP90677.1 hypothetical protein EIN_023660 [Entamoeba invadens IP1]BAN41981.1 hypothetical protein [Entamoeba invadens]|eukprot:XP_004257448.1 hypothetical protein EIN_023660 [Entamoeba invadens IP1]
MSVLLVALILGVYADSNFTKINTFESNVYIHNLEDLNFQMMGKMYYNAPQGQMVTVFKSINHVDAVFRDNGERYYSYHRMNATANVLNRTHAVFYNITFDKTASTHSLFINHRLCREYKGVSPYLDYAYVDDENQLCRVCFETGKCISFLNFGILSSSGQSVIDENVQKMTSDSSKNTGRAARILLMIDPAFGGTEETFNSARLDLLTALDTLAMAKSKTGSANVEIAVQNYDGTQSPFSADFKVTQDALSKITFSATEITPPLAQAISLIKNYTGSNKAKPIILSLNKDSTQFKGLVEKYNTTLREISGIVYSESFETAASSTYLDYEAVSSSIKDKFYFFYKTSSLDLINSLVVDPVMHLSTRFLSQHMCKSCYGYCLLAGNDTTQLVCELKSPDDKEAIETSVFVNGCTFSETVALVYKIIGGVGMLALVIVAIVELLLVLLQRVLCGSGRQFKNVMAEQITVTTQSSLYEAEDNEAQNPMFQDS